MDKLFEKNKQINTACHDCVFKESKEGIQLGCDFNRIEKFKKLNLVEESNGSFLIKDFCNRCRNKDSMHNKNMTYEKYKEYIEKTTRVTLDYIIYFDKTSTKTELLKTVKCIEKQTIPYTILHIVTELGVKNKEIIELLEKNKVKFVLHNILIKQSDLLSLDIPAKKAKSQFMMFLKAGSNIDSKVNEKLDIIINVEMKKISLIRPENSEFDKMIVQTFLYNLLVGNKNVSIEKKIEYLAQEQKLENMIKSWKEFKNEC